MPVSMRPLVIWVRPRDRARGEQLALRLSGITAEPVHLAEEGGLVSADAVRVAALPHPTTADVLSAMAHGAHAVLDIDSGDAEIAHGLRVVLRDGCYVPAGHQAAVAEAIVRRRRDEPQRRARFASLTPNEREILVLLAQGADRAVIAARLNESVSRVRARIDRVKAKLGASSQREAVALVAEYVNWEG